MMPITRNLMQAALPVRSRLALRASRLPPYLFNQATAFNRTTMLHNFDIPKNVQIRTINLFRTYIPSDIDIATDKLRPLGAIMGIPGNVFGMWMGYEFPKTAISIYSLAVLYLIYEGVKSHTPEAALEQSKKDLQNKQHELAEKQRLQAKLDKINVERHAIQAQIVELDKQIATLQKP